MFGHDVGAKMRFVERLDIEQAEVGGHLRDHHRDGHHESVRDERGTGLFETFGLILRDRLFGREGFFGIANGGDQFSIGNALDVKDEVGNGIAHGILFLVKTSADETRTEILTYLHFI
ncbi:hypothetical protein RSSM_06228 [Rhodopirellula sallentina SM41]|uniref:Uncharacterized protein n=1 Tax=Rhodopirellula sallentina SM41 TaxID=1263870 RepID=M5TT00_9BACT|nr:hypothetical protein RSSM_06228 [Rhodopirellula sallentina SM41]